MITSELKKKVGQLLVVGFGGKTVPKVIKDLIHDYHVGSIILFSRNIGNPSEVLALTTALQMEAKRAGHSRPLLICIDQENGVVRRLNEGYTAFPGAMALGATGNPKHAYRIGLATGEELRTLGINWNLAPVLDVNNNPNNPVIGVRSYGESPEKVARFGASAMKGMQDAGIATTLKHFPGHGDTTSDSHLDLPVINHQMERLEEVELRPFKECIDAGADAVMSAHIYFPAIEKNPGTPATLSKPVITGLLRGKLGFQGVVTTDCMEMNAISETVGTEKGAAAAVKAGVDLIMVSHTYEKQIGAIQEIIREVEAGELDKALIDKSVERISALKDKYLNWADTLIEEKKVIDIIGSKKHEKLAAEIYKDSVTIVKNNGLIPLKLSGDSQVLVVFPEPGSSLNVEDKHVMKQTLGEAIKEYHPATEVYSFSHSLGNEEIETIMQRVQQFSAVIVGTMTLVQGSKQITLIEKLVQSGVPIVVVAMRSPYDLAHLNSIQAYIATYEFSYPALQVAAGAIFGKVKAGGRLPVKVY